MIGGIVVGVCCEGRDKPIVIVIGVRCIIMHCTSASMHVLNLLSLLQSSHKESKGIGCVHKSLLHLEVLKSIAQATAFIGVPE